MRLRAFVLILLALAAVSLSACGASALEDKDELLRAISATEHSAREFIYREKTADKEVAVTGVFEDDLRHSALLVENELGVIEQVTSDDTLAVRIMQPDKVLSGIAPVADPGAALSLEALRKGEWVVDPSGAAPLSTAPEEGGAAIGDDPIRNALKFFAYARQAITEAQGVKEWEEDDLFPAYVRSEDTFDQPNRSLGVKRFDLVRVPIPRQIGTTQEIPIRPFHFRKMVFYVKDGKVIRVLEEVDFESHIDFTRARETKRDPDLIRLLERVRKGEVTEPINNRRLSLDIVKQAKGIRVAIPGGVTSTLAGLFAPIPGEETEPSGEPLGQETGQSADQQQPTQPAPPPSPSQ